ncbi:MAG TPA: AAA family ATPase [Phycisphaerae bacterium]|nr:AAA family ATPase [Phycisphaerae bacterium]
MIACIEALNYRCLRYVRQEVGSFQVLVGPNASGKSTFLDVVAFIGDLLEHGLTKAVHDRSADPRALTWMARSDRFELAVELIVPDELRARVAHGNHQRARYEVAVGLNGDGELAVLGENFWLKGGEDPRQEQQALLFPDPPAPPEHIVLPEGRHSPRGWRKVVTKGAKGTDYFMSETSKWNNPFRLGPQKAALGGLPEDEQMFPVATWARRMLIEGIQRLALNSEAMRRAAPPGTLRHFLPDGSNLPRVVKDLRDRSHEAFDRWIAHVQTALPDLATVETERRDEDRHSYLRLVYTTGLRAPSWTVSDGTLRLLALTLLAYLGEPHRTYLIEEPENGIHPTAVETVIQALSSAYDAQVLCASHSPVVLSRTEPDQLLCFARNEDGATDIRRGDLHPLLRDWQRGADLGTLFASGVLG